MATAKRPKKKPTPKTDETDDPPFRLTTGERLSPFVRTPASWIQGPVSQDWKHEAIGLLRDIQARANQYGHVSTPFYESVYHVAKRLANHLHSQFSKATPPLAFLTRDRQCAEDSLYTSEFDTTRCLLDPDLFPDVQRVRIIRVTDPHVSHDEFVLWGESNVEGQRTGAHQRVGETLVMVHQIEHSIIPAWVRLIESLPTEASATPAPEQAEPREGAAGDEFVSVTEAAKRYVVQMQPKIIQFKSAVETISRACRNGVIESSGTRKDRRIHVTSLDAWMLQQTNRAATRADKNLTKRRAKSQSTTAF